MTSDNTAPFQYKICGYRLDRSWLEAWGRKQGFIKPEDFGEIVTGGYDEIITGARALDSTVTALEEAIKGLGIKEEQGGIGTIGREGHHPELCAYVAHNDNPGREELPDKNTMMKLKALLELRMDEEPQWYESTTATIRGG